MDVTLKEILTELVQESLSSDFTTHSGPLDKISLNFWVMPTGEIKRIPMQGHNNWAKLYISAYPDKYQKRLKSGESPQNILHREGWLKMVAYDVWNEPVIRLAYIPESPPNATQMKAIRKWIEDFNTNHDNKITYIQDDTMRTKMYLQENILAENSVLNNPNFKKWFEGSKIVDKFGNPLRMYHGTDGDFTKFDPDKTGDVGFYFTSDPEEANTYATFRGKENLSVMPVYLKIINPATTEIEEKIAKEFSGKLGGNPRKYINRILQQRGYDGIVRGTHVIVFNSNQIKSATGNNGSFDISNSNILSENEKLNERLTFADLYDDTDDDRIFKSKLPGMRVRPMAITMENGNESWNFGYTSQEKSQYQRHGGKVGHKGKIIFFKDSVEPEDNAEDLECMVDCDCKDFQFRWAYVNAQDDASIIGPKSLNKAINRPPIKTNPTGHQQLCKHLAALVRYLTTNIDRARQRAHIRRRPMNIFEALDDVTKKGHDNWQYYDKDNESSLNENIEKVGYDVQEERPDMPVNWEDWDIQTNGPWDENKIREFAGLPKNFVAIYRAVLDVSDLYPKVEEDPADFDWSEFRMKKNGFPPIVVMRDENSRLRIMDGNHRAHYAEELGYQTIGAWVVDKIIQKDIEKRSLQETRIIEPEHALSNGYITLYHGTNWPIALKAKKGELGPQDMEKLIINILVEVFHESPQTAKAYYDKFASIRRKDPPRLFLTTSRKGAEGYARSTTKWGGELFYDVISGYMYDKDENLDRDILAKKLKTDEPSIVTITVPLEMVLTHPHWTTPLKHRLRDIMLNLKKYPDIKDSLFDHFNLEVFVTDKIPARFVQRIDQISSQKDEVDKRT